MDFTDVASLRIKILGDEAKKDLQALKNGATDIKSELTLLENSGKKGTVAYSELKRLQKEVNEEIKISTRNIDLQGASLNQMRAIKAQLNGELNKLAVGSAAWIAKMNEIAPVNAKIKETENAVRGVGGEADKQKGTWERFSGWIKGAFIVGVVIEFGRQILGAAMGVLNLTAKFEKYEVVLKNALGSQEKATAALKMLKELAATTPFSLDEMTASFNKMVQRGLMPTSSEIKKLADLAASQGKTFDMLTEAVLDAQMGEGERLKEFGIRMKKSGDDVSLSFKGQTVSVKNNEKAIFDAIVAMGAYNGVAGVTGEVSDKLSGKISNMGDLWDFVTVSLGTKLKPVFHFVLDMLGRGIKVVADLIENVRPLGIVFNAVAFIFSKVLEAGRNLFLAAFPVFEGKSISAAQAMKILATILMTVPAALMTVRAAIIAVVDYFRILGDAAKVAGKFLTGDFTGAAAAAGQLGLDFQKLKNNAATNFGAIGKSFSDIWKNNTTNTDKGLKEWDTYVEENKKGAKEITATSAAELKKQATAKEKAIEEDRKMWIEYNEDKEKFNKKMTEAFKKLDEEYTKWLFDEYEKRSKIIDNAVDDIQKNIAKKELAAVKASGERNKEALEHLKDRIANFGKSEEERIEKDTKLNLDALEKKKQKTTDFVNYGLDAYTVLLQKASDYFTKIAETSESSSKRMNAAITNEFIKPMTDNLNAAKALMQGDFVGAAEGLIGYFKGLWDVTIGLKKTLKEAALIEFNKTFEADFAKLGQYNDQIKAVFGDLANATAQLQAAQDNSLSGRIAAELKVGEKIKENYALATEKENAYYETRRKAIEDAYSLEVQRINDKYSLLSTMASMQFSAESLAIQAKVNEDLMRFVTNEETKQSLTADYQARKNQILTAYASQIKPITEGMSQTEIDGINAAIKARDEQLARVEAWFLAELQYVIANEEQKRKVYSETELIIQKGKEATDLLAVKYAADELERQTKKNLELVSAENTKNAGLEAAAKTHNDTLVALAAAKDAALIASFDNVRDAMLSGYAAMEAAATEAYNKGLITAAQFGELINRANILKNLVTGPVKLYDRGTVNDLQPVGGDVQLYAGGTSYVDAAGRYPNGVDTVPAYLTKGERVVPSDLNKLLGGMSNEQLVASLYRPSASLSDSLQNSGLSRAGASMLMNGGMVNYVSGSAIKSGPMQVVAAGGSGAASAGGADGGMAENNKLMAALIDLIAGQTNAELRKIAQKPNLSLHDVENAAAASGDLNRLSNF